MNRRMLNTSTAPSGLIMPAETETKPPYDLSKCFRTFSRGDLMIWLTWNRVTGEPCMVLTPKMAVINAETCVPCIVPLARAWVWSEAHGSEEEALFCAAMFCANLGFNPYNHRNVFKVAGIVRDYLQDLLTMPPLPSGDREIVAEAIIRDNATGKESFKEISDHA